MAKLQGHNYYEDFHKETVERHLTVHLEVADYEEASWVLRYLKSICTGVVPAEAVPAPKTDLPVATDTETAPSAPAEPPKTTKHDIKQALGATFDPNKIAAAFAQSMKGAEQERLQTVPAAPAQSEPPVITVQWSLPEQPVQAKEEVLVATVTLESSVPPPEKVHVSPEVENPDLVNSVVFLFEEDCKGIKSIENAVKVWKDHAGAIKKLQEPDKLRCSNTIALRLSEVLGVEPMEAKEVLKAALTKKSEPPAGVTANVPKAIQPVITTTQIAPAKAPAAPPVPEKVQEAPAPSETTSGAAEGVLGALANEPKPLLGLAVKHACTYLKTEQGVHAKMVEDLLVSMIGKHPVLDVPAEDIYKITRGAAMKLYAGAAKTKLL